MDSYVHIKTPISGAFRQIAAVDHELRPGHIARFVTCEKQYAARDLDRLRHAFHCRAAEYGLRNSRALRLNGRPSPNGPIRQNSAQIDECKSTFGIDRANSIYKLDILDKIFVTVALHTYSLMYDRHGGLLCPVDCTVSGWPT